MRRLADFMLMARGEELPVSVPVRGDLRRRLLNDRYVTLGFAAQDASAARELVGHEARLVTNIHLPGREVGRLKVLKVDSGPSSWLPKFFQAGEPRRAENAPCTRVSHEAVPPCPGLRRHDGRGGRLDPEVRSAIDEARAHGIVVVVVTGRVLEDFREASGDLSWADAYVCENGAVVALSEGEPRVQCAAASLPLRRALELAGIRCTAGRCVIEADAPDAERSSPSCASWSCRLRFISTGPGSWSCRTGCASRAGFARCSAPFDSPATTHSPSVMPRTTMTCWRPVRSEPPSPGAPLDCGEPPT